MAKTTNDAKYADLFEQLKKISKDALSESPAPAPIIVGTPTTPLGSDIDYSKQVWLHSEGVCGFATVVLESGRSGFAQWLLANNYGSKWWSFGRHKGVGVATYPRYGFANIGQSYERNKFVASKIAEYLRAQGIACWVDSRVD